MLLLLTYKFFQFIHSPTFINSISSYNSHGPWCPKKTINSLGPRKNKTQCCRRHFLIQFFNENMWIWHKISLKFVPKVGIYLIPSLAQIKAWRRTGDKPLSEPMMVSLPTHICVTRPQWVNLNALGPIDAIWQHKSESTLAQVMVCCLTAPNHYLNQCWLIITNLAVSGL